MLFSLYARSTMIFSFSISKNVIFEQLKRSYDAVSSNLKGIIFVYMTWRQTLAEGNILSIYFALIFLSITAQMSVDGKYTFIITFDRIEKQ